MTLPREQSRDPRLAPVGPMPLDSVLLESFLPGELSRSYLFRDPEQVIEVFAHSQVLPALQRIEKLVAAGKHAAGFIAYEAAAGFDPRLVTRPPAALPLLWFGIYGEREEVLPGLGIGERFRTVDWEDSLDFERYALAINNIRDLIARGDTYQVNFTLRRRFHFAGDGFGLYRELCRSQQTRFSAYLGTARWQILSVSPELFFAVEDGTITTRPMKGTAARGKDDKTDEDARRNLQADAKERAENLMIVDLLRNDLGKICTPGSITVPSLFQVESLETLYQMTSTVTGQLRSDTTISEIFTALFPCGSITGAPKARTMEIIRDLEETPRGVYAGAIGFISPGGEATFSVPIRTAVIDTLAGTGEIGVGGGITWDSSPEAEYREAMNKGRFATNRTPEFGLIETLLWEEGRLNTIMADR